MNISRLAWNSLVTLTHANFSSFSLLCLFLAGCAIPEIRMTVSEPSVYTDDQSLKAFAEQQKRLDALSANITYKDIQSRFGALQATRTDASVSISLATGEVASPPDPAESENIKLPSPPPPNDNIGLLHEALLRKKISQEQDLMGWKLKILGDSRVHNEAENRLVLLRFDVSINNYLKGETWLGEKNFAIINFAVKTSEPSSCHKKPIVYSLVPEFTSSVGEESLVTNNLENLALQGGGSVEGVDIAGAGRFQRALEEYLQTLVEEPVQFAIYRQNSFAFAFGPTRQIYKRSWLDPRRWLGNTYQIDYEIEPGPRDVYALLIIPKCARELKVSYKPSKDVRTDNFDAKHEPKPMLVALFSPPPPSSTDPDPEEKHFSGIPIPDSSPTCTTGTDSHTVFPALTNTIFIHSANSVSSETEAMIGPIGIPRKNIKIFGRHQLQITIPPNEGLAKLLKGGKTPQDLSIINPGQEKCTVGEANLVGVDLPPKLATEEFVLDPTAGAENQYVKLTVKNSKLDFRQIKSVIIQDKNAVRDSGVDPKKDHLFFKLPSLSSEAHPETLVSVKIEFNDGTTRFLHNVLTYKAKASP